MTRFIFPSSRPGWPIVIRDVTDYRAAEVRTMVAQRTTRPTIVSDGRARTTESCGFQRGRKAP